jgi:3-deoxy-manno-octulosonate cytidylyltransferase (CMP-KDO synthetase)
MAERPPAVTVVIPARYASSRFPGKPLAEVAGKALIQHVYERVQGCPAVTAVVVATDDERIAAAVRRFGGSAVLTTEPCRTGTDRVAAVARRLPGDLFVNLQGDEIVLVPDLLAELVTAFVAGGAGMGTLKRALTSVEEIRNPGVVKVVTDRAGLALYFSRAPIPHHRDRRPGEPPAAGHFVHLGIYIFTRETLMRFAGLPTGLLEDTEKLEQLRALEHGIPIRVWETRHPTLRIDSPEDVAAAEKALEGCAVGGPS